jgi:hypothetical protein
MNYALVSDQATVANIIKADADFIESIRSDWADIIDLASYQSVHIGDQWDGQKFTPPAPDVDAAWDGVRKERDALLRDSDWTQLPDVPLTAEQRDAWAIYRQSLRDITTQTESPWEVKWPAPPSI